METYKVNLTKQDKITVEILEKDLSRPKSAVMLSMSHFVYDEDTFDYEDRHNSMWLNRKEAIELSKAIYRAAMNL